MPANDFRTCITCKWCGGPNEQRIEETDGDHEMTCHRFPIQMVGGPEASGIRFDCMWPTVTLDDWCGEWSPADDLSER